MTFIKGNKTYIVAVIAGGITIARWVGWIDEATYQLLIGLCGSGAAITLRAGSKDDAAKATSDTCGCLKNE